jgi:small subunit ribosomal protein S9
LFTAAKATPTRRKSPRRWLSSKAGRNSQEDTPIATQDSIRATGRRKTAIARVIIKPGTGKRIINDRTFTEFFANAIREMIVEQPLTILNVNKQWDVIVTSKGGGVNGTAGAVRLGIARALVELDPDDRPALKKAGFLTRDARVKERKKYGLKKARKAPQYSKR